ncbi:MAG: hypothetical protein B7733_01275 [Myxococcales bacterium FL481]|nr:MAG: hypothetical protein B7733_01275 [Myxococcales bacterium FL481]
MNSSSRARLWPPSRTEDPGIHPRWARQGRRHRHLAGCKATLLGLLLSSCDAAETVPAHLPAPDLMMFRQMVYPVLLRDCAFVECHGSADRLYQVYGPGRVRLGGLDNYDAPSDEELQFGYNRSRAMLLHLHDLDNSPLLRKPLQGAGHGGLDGYGRNVYLGEEDPAWRIIERWALTSGRESEGQ